MRKEEMTVRALKYMLVLSVLAVACGGSVKKDGKSEKGSNDANATQNGEPNNENGDPTNVKPGNNVNAQPAACGDGVLDPGELCDPGIAEGAGACPTSCAAGNCSTAELVGDPNACTAQCIVSPLACMDGDGCCPEGCEGTTDGDCSNACGDGIVEGPEACDGNCPTSCDDGNTCTTDTLLGSAAACSAQCSFDPIATCQSGDGCCPAGCDASRDNDCAPSQMCGNGIVEAGESCDGNCPTSCNDGNACTSDVMNGTAASCNVTCTNAAITSCQSGDGCCPAGCTFANDNDCACTPKTCAQVGAECGMIDDGCGSTVACANTCSTIELCSGTTCVQENNIGNDCTDYPQCSSTNHAVCFLDPGWPDGYCSLICDGASGNTLCPTGSHCADFGNNEAYCLSTCTSAADCKAGYVCEQGDGVGPLECIPPTDPPGDGEIGSSCGSDADCGIGLSCYFESTNPLTNLTTQFPGGVCSQTCVPGADTCGIGAACTLHLICMQACQSSAECRAGWECGGVTLEPHCWPS